MGAEQVVSVVKFVCLSLLGGEKFITRGQFFKYPEDKEDEENHAYLYESKHHSYFLMRDRYGGEKPNRSLAAKSCNNDIKGNDWFLTKVRLNVSGWTNFFAADTSSLFKLPLLIIIGMLLLIFWNVISYFLDYAGYRLEVASIVPIKKGSLVYVSHITIIVR